MNRWKLIILAFLAIPCFGAHPEGGLDARTCAVEVADMARDLWTTDVARARTLNYRYQMPFDLAFRLRSYFGVSTDLATRLVLSAEGLRVLVRAVSHGVARVDPPLMAALNAQLDAAQRVELARVLPALYQDAILLSACQQIVRTAVLFFPNHRELQVSVGLDPIFFPNLGMLLGIQPDPVLLNAAGRDLGARYSLDELKRIAGLAAVAIRDNPDARQQLMGLLLPDQFAAQGQFVKPRNQAAISMPTYIEALRGSGEYSDLASLNELIMAIWIEKTNHIMIASSDDGAAPFWEMVFSPWGVDFNLAAFHLLRGKERDAQAAFDSAFKSLGISGESRWAIEAAVREVAADPRLRVSTIGEFLLKKKVSPEILLAQMAEGNLSLVETRSGVPFYPMVARFQQVPMIYAALLYGRMEPGCRVLEIGYERPVIAVALKHYLPHIGSIVGVDIAPLPSDAVINPLRERGIELFQGNPPYDTQMRDEINRRGPYSLIYGVDVFRGTYGGAGQDFSAKVSNADYLKWVLENLNPGGVFLVLNDNKEVPNFSRAEAERAGFTVVRWREEWEIPIALRELLALRDPSTGLMALYVLRKGELPARQERFIVTPQVKK